MLAVEFEWDPSKDLGNQRKHGLSFTEARQLFESGKDYLEVFDLEHSEIEDRFIAIGRIERGVVVVVCTERDEDIIRIIGARPAGKREKALYHAEMGKFK